MKKFVSRDVVPRVLWLLRLVLPARSHVVLYGYPSIEGNVVETARNLVDQYRGSIIWLDGPGDQYLQSIGFPKDARIAQVPKWSWHGLLAYVTGQAVFFTHGLYGVPRTVARKPTVNVWHGEGMKRNENLFPGRRMGGAGADYMAGMSRLFAGLAAAGTGMPADRILYSGLPRNDELFRPCASDRLQSLGIDPERPFVVWMPSFRQAAARSADGSWVDSTDLATDEALASILADASRTLTGRGVQLVVKPHPIDAIARDVPGSILIDDALLTEAGVTMYSVLGRAAGLITDVSSVGNDYLLLDRPIAYFFPDRDAYVSTRGVWPEDALDHLPGPEVSSSDDFAAFADEVLGITAAHALHRRGTREWAGFVETQSAGRELLDMLCQRSSAAFAKNLQMGPRNCQGEGGVSSIPRRPG